MPNPKCRILFILTSLVIGGAEKQLVTLINHLDNDFFELHFTYLKNKTELLPQINQHKLQGFFYGGVEKKVDFKTGRLLAQYVDEHQIDIIVSTNTYPLIYATLANFLSKRRLLMVDVLHSSHFESFRDYLGELIYWPLLRSQHRLVYVSENQRTYWQQKYLLTHNDCVIYNGIDTDYFFDTYTAEEKLIIRQNYGFSQDDYLIGICAALRPEKAHGDLLQAIKNLRISGISAKCLIIGDGNERTNIEQQIVDLGLQSDVMITGYQQDVRPYIAACDVMTIVSHFESFSIALLEAMSMGKPVIRSDVCGGPELVTENVDGYLFPAGNIQTLETALLNLNNNDIRALFGKSAREKAEHFAVNKMVAKYQQLFLELKRAYFSKN